MWHVATGTFGSMSFVKASERWCPRCAGCDNPLCTGTIRLNVLVCPCGGPLTVLRTQCPRWTALQCLSLIGVLAGLLDPFTEELSAWPRLSQINVAAGLYGCALGCLTLRRRDSAEHCRNLRVLFRKRPTAHHVDQHFTAAHPPQAPFDLPVAEVVRMDVEPSLTHANGAQSIRNTALCG